MNNHQIISAHEQTSLLRYAHHREPKGYQPVVTVVMKNCDPLVSGPAFAIDKNPTPRKQKSISSLKSEGMKHLQVFTWSCVLELEVLVSKVCAIDRLSSPSITKGEVTSLNHEAGNDPVECAPLVVKGLPTFTHTFLT